MFDRVLQILFFFLGTSTLAEREAERHRKRAPVQDRPDAPAPVPEAGLTADRPDADPAEAADIKCLSVICVLSVQF